MKTAVRILLILLALCAAGNVSAFISPFPLAETEKIVSVWLKDSGFETAAIYPEDGILLQASSKNRQWKVMLRPYSPLATSVEAECSINGSIDPVASAAVEKHLMSYDSGRSSGADMLLGVPKEVSAHERAVVCIRAENKGRPVQFSGFFIDRSGRIIGTAHDLGETKKVVIRLPDGKETTGRVLRTDKRADLSLIESEVRGDSFISLQHARALVDFGESVYAIGCPLDKAGTVTRGVIGGPLRLSENLPLWQAGMKTMPGGSGSPVFDASGRFIGVVRGRYKGDDSRGFIIPSGTVNTFRGKN